MEKKYILEGLDCPNCALKVEKALNKHPHIKEANVNAATLLCMIDYKEYDETIGSYIKELESEMNENGEDEGSLDGLIIDKEYINKKYEKYLAQYFVVKIINKQYL